LLRHAHVAREEIVAFQNKQLRCLITHAHKNVPYYRRLFDQNGIKPKDIQTVADLSIIPITSKKDLQLLPSEEVVAHGVNPERLISRRTSGSSGEPFTIRRAWLEERLLGLFRLRAMYYLGQRPTDKVARITLVHPSHPRDNQLPMQILRAMRLFHTRQINRLLLPESIVRELRNFHPDVLTGPPGALSQLTQIIGDEDRLLIRPRFVRLSGEVVTPVMRRQITKAFKAPVFEAYTSREFGVIAWECKETGELHTSDDSVIREYVTVHRAAKEGGETRVGRGCMLMALCHLAHDCQIADGAIITSYAALAGHVEIGEGVVLGGLAAFHQHVRVGRLAMVGGMSRVIKDVPPFVIAEGNPCRVRGLNSVGLRRAGLPLEARRVLKRAFRLLYRSGLNTSQALASIRSELPPDENVDRLVAFIESSKRGTTAAASRDEATEDE
jgi:acyl-ACP--UDP-N-acetylglucosamine O-acyltransferase